VKEAEMPKDDTSVTMLKIAAQFRQVFNDEMAKQVHEYNGQALAQEIISQLNRDRHATIWKLLGLENRWGNGWEVDHCNGRKSVITDMMADSVGTEVREWLNESIREVIATNRPKMKAEFRKALEREIKEQAHRMVWQYANGAAEDMMEDIRKEVEKEFKEGVRNASIEEAQRESPAGQTDQA
jgi:hypothetical protein